MAYLYPSSELSLPQPFYEVSGPSITLGRHPSNDVSVLLESVSRFHAKIESRDTGYILHDLNSSNGTYLNGERIAGPRAIYSEDVVTLGRADFIFSVIPPAERGKHVDRGADPKAETSENKVNLVGEETGESIILSTRTDIDSNQLKASDFFTAERDDVDSLKKSNERLLALYRLSEIIRSAATRGEVMSGVVDLVFDILAADRVAILTFEGPDNKLQTQIMRHRAPSPKPTITISRTIVNKCVQGRAAILSRDVRVDSRFKASESIMAGEIRSAICVPLISKDRILGIFFIDSRESVRAFTQDDLVFVTSLANDLALTLENLALVEENIRNERLAAIGQTIAGLAHNIKNILQLSKGGMELMSTAIEKRSFNEIDVYWPIVRRGIDRMQSMTREMLDFSGQSRPHLIEDNVNNVIMETIQSFEREGLDEGVGIVVDLSPDVPTRKLDPEGLFKSLMNLITNAIEAFEELPGEVEISTSFEDDTILLRVRDDGKGIPEKKLSNIFQPFFTTKGSKGTGLGLSMTKKYIDDMGGSISVESEEGKGTTFTIAFPLASPRLQLEEPEPVEMGHATQAES